MKVYPARDRVKDVLIRATEEYTVAMMEPKTTHVVLQTRDVATMITCLRIVLSDERIESEFRSKLEGEISE